MSRTKCRHRAALQRHKDGLLRARTNFQWVCLALAHTHTRLTALCPGLPGWAGTRGKTSLDFTEARDSEWHWHQLGHMQVCISLQTDNVPAPHHSVFYRADALHAAQPTVSKHWRHCLALAIWKQLQIAGNSLTLNCRVLFWLATLVYFWINCVTVTSVW